MSLKSRLIVQSVFSLALLALAFFLPAGTFHYWQAWVFIAIVYIPMVIFAAYFYQHDRALLERRMQRKEKVKEQKWIMRLVTIVTFGGLLIPGLDHRFGWTRQLTGGVPLWLEIPAQVLVATGYLMTMWVINVNRFAARTIQVEQGQHVISTGPYRLVRHPMYSGAVLMWLAAAPALGSWVALPFCALLLPVMALRLLNEEKVLQKELPGYTEYCEKTRHHLIPYVW